MEKNKNLLDAETETVTRYKLHKVKKNWVVKGKGITFLLTGLALGIGGTMFVGATSAAAAETNPAIAADNTVTAPTEDADTAVAADSEVTDGTTTETGTPETTGTTEVTETTETQTTDDPTAGTEESSAEDVTEEAPSTDDTTTTTDNDSVSVDDNKINEDAPTTTDEETTPEETSPTETETTDEDALAAATAEQAPQTLGSVTSVEKDGNDYEVHYSTGEVAKVSVLNGHVIRYHMDPTGTFPEYPTPNDPKHTATITTKTQEEYGTESFDNSTATETDDQYQIDTDDVQLAFDKTSGLMTITDKRTDKAVVQEAAPLNYQNGKTTQTLTQDADEYFYGGGTQNGRFSHKGNLVQIVNAQGWTDGSVANPSPFYWSTDGYGVLRNTFQKGTYDFGYQDSSIVTTSHDGEDFDAYYFIDSDPADILSDYYELTGNPVLLPEYGFYEAHLNAYNRDYWKEVPEGTKGAVLMMDGKWYTETQPVEEGSGETNEGTLETLNGENDSYMFSAREVIDEYIAADMPLGWFLPNDGYGAGYGQTDSLDGDVANLKAFVDYANNHGIEVGLWTQQNLHPADPANPQKKERDIDKEVKDAGITALKTDVAWVGSGYSFGLNGTQDASDVFVDETNGAVRPMIVTICAWAGTQRNAAVWTGDQYGGDWEYIRFHIPTYIGTSLSGQPNVGSDMDGIFSGGNKEVNIRDYQWKAFTPIQLNMDGWGSNPKNPFAFDDQADDINRAYLKLKSEMMPYIYSIADEATDGLPMIRGMFLEFPEEQAAYTTDSQYQYMWGSNLLVAPIYNGDVDADGNSIRNGVYLPDKDQVWIDLFTGEKHQGGSVLNNVKVPLWKLPVYVRDGAIIPMTNPNNNPSEIDHSNRIYLVYPNGQSEFKQYEDDGISTGYKDGASATTLITSDGPASNQTGDLTITIGKTTGTYEGMVTDRTTEVDVMASEAPETVTALVNGAEVQLTAAKSLDEFNKGENVYFLDEDFQIDTYLSEASGEDLGQSFLRIKLAKQDVTESEIQINVAGFTNKGAVIGENDTVTSTLAVPTNVAAPSETTTPTGITVTWDAVDGATSYDVERDGLTFTNIADTTFTFDGFNYSTDHTFKVRAVSDAGVSEWSDELTATTNANPYSNTIDGVTATANIPDHDPIANLTDKDLTDIWHSDWNQTADPDNGNNLIVDFNLGEIYPLDKMTYFPRQDNGGNGNFGKIQYRTSVDGVNWTDYSDPITWKTDLNAKDIELGGKEMQYIEVKVLASTGNFGSGSEMLFYQTPGTSGRVLGDISNNGAIDDGDATSFTNYIGINSTDASFEGYVNKGDVNNNGLIDAYDLSYVLSKLDGGVTTPAETPVAGTLSVVSNKTEVKSGDEVTFTLQGKDLANVNALGAQFDLDKSKFTLVAGPAVGEAAAGMENYSTVRDHSDGSSTLYLGLSNLGEKNLLNGDADLVTFTIKVNDGLSAEDLAALTLNLTQGILVGNDMSQATIADSTVSFVTTGAPETGEPTGTEPQGETPDSTTNETSGSTTGETPVEPVAVAVSPASETTAAQLSAKVDQTATASKLSVKTKIADDSAMPQTGEESNRTTGIIGLLIALVSGSFLFGKKKRED